MRDPRAEGAHYDAGRHRIIIRPTTGIEIALAPHDVEGLEHASAADLTAVKMEAFRLSFRFPTIDADLYIPALLDGVLG